MKTKTFTLLITLILLCLSSIAKTGYSQTEEDPRAFRYFKINANMDDDSLFYKIQKEMRIDPMLSTFLVVVNIVSTDPDDQYVCIGEENDPTKVVVRYCDLSQEVQRKLVNWVAPNKIDLIKPNYTYSTPVTSTLNKISFSKMFRPTQKLHQVTGKYNYINPYLQLFGAERLGAALKGTLGTTFGIGTKYSGPFESDQISVGLNILGVSMNYITRLKSLNTHTIDNTGESSFWKQYNNVFSPPNAWEINIMFPFGNFLEFGYYKPFGDIMKGEPAYYFYENGDSAKQMPNNIIQGDYFNFELRYPFKFFDAVKSQVYAAYYLKEAHIGFFTRESRVAGSVFDIRVNYTISKVRNNQLLFEMLFSNLWESFGSSSIAIGPSFRISKLESGKTGLHTFFLNARFKLGDFYTEK